MKRGPWPVDAARRSARLAAAGGPDNGAGGSWLDASCCFSQGAVLGWRVGDGCRWRPAGCGRAASGRAKPTASMARRLIASMT